jgi:hypothetical protein
VPHEGDKTDQGKSDIPIFLAMIGTLISIATFYYSCRDRSEKEAENRPILELMSTTMVSSENLFPKLSSLKGAPKSAPLPAHDPTDSIKNIITNWLKKPVQPGDVSAV